MKKLNLQKGFTILESMFAIFILSLAVSGAFTAVQQGLSQAIMAKDEVRAYYLAQEAIEIIRNKRDANQIDKVLNGSTNGWLAGIAEVGDPCEIDPVTHIGRVCRVDVLLYPYNPPNPNPIQPCGTTWDSCAEMTYDEAGSKLYTYDLGNTTDFRREIMIEQVISNPNEIMVTVRVKWGKGLRTKEFKAKTHLFNWVS